MPTNNPVSSNIIYQELAKRAAGKDALSMEGRLKIKLDTIIHDAEGHLSRVNQFLPEFDDHSVKHSEAVLDNMALIIGEEGIKNLSVYDLFILAASAYLHDIGMALTGYEKEVLTLAEKEPLPVNIGGVAECKKIIVDNSTFVFGQQIEDALTINILPQEKTNLIDFLAKLYEEYQNFRNGYTEKFRNAKDDDNKDDLNKNIRMDYIRETHPKRSAEYVKHWGDRIQEEDTSLSEVFNDIAKVVQGHGESFESIKGLSGKAEYEAIDDKEDSDTANLQFAAMMLRLGDIVHFTYDRAPANLRKETRFHSEVSKDQWKVKNGVSNKITKTADETKITFKASCASPQAYCYLIKYIGYINFEIEGFNALKSNWESRYKIPLVEVENKVKPLKNAFETRPDLTFTLNQNKILELLMGVQLYKDPYTCLRELYQNSLDACRCAIARRKTLGEVNPTCTIEFGMEKDDKGNKYIYCLDDGKGMSNSIIENYFLKIGSSYYKSKEFFTEWAKNNGGFTPTSQFGIGILSCFMIGERLEVVTKEFGKKLISFGVDGPQETFYYWNKDNINLSDKETFEHRLSGTLIKVYLKEQYAKELDDGELDKLELLKCDDSIFRQIDEFVKFHHPKIDEAKYLFLHDYREWSHHFYKKIFDFVQIPFPDIKVQVYYANSLHPIEPRPHMANVDVTEFKKEIMKFEKLEGVHFMNEMLNKNSNSSHFVEYPIKIGYPYYIYHSIICLPKEENVGFDFYKYYHAKNCVDGVRVEDSNDFKRFEKSKSNVVEPIYHHIVSGLAYLSDHGIFNFVGEHKPAIKVDRCSFVNPIHIDNAEQLFSDYLDEVIRVTNEHIEKYGIGKSTLFYQKIWGWVIENLPYSIQILLTNHLDKQGYPLIKSDSLSAFFGLDENVPTILAKQFIPLPLKKTLHDSMFFWRKRIDSNHVFLFKKLSAVKSVKFTKDDTLELSFDNLPSVLPYIDIAGRWSKNAVIIGIPNDDGLFNSYDIVDAYYPLVSHRLAKELPHHFTNHWGTRVIYFDFILKFGHFYGDLIQHYSQSEQFKYMNAPSFEFQKKRIDFCQFDEHLYYFNTFTHGSENNYEISYISFYFYKNKTGGKENSEGVSIIIPMEYSKYRCFLIAKGRFTREEMDEIVRIGRKMMK